MFVLPCDVSDALSPPRGRAGRPARAWTKLPDWITYAWPLVSVLLLSIRDARARDAIPGGRGSVPAPPPRPDPLPSHCGGFGRSGWHRAPAPGKGLLLGWGPGTRGNPPGRVTPGCFINIYIYIFCSKVLLPHVRVGAPRIARIPKPGLGEAAPVGGSAVPGGSPPLSGGPPPALARPQPSQCPWPSPLQSCSRFFLM